MNKVMLQGRLTSNPEIKVTGTGKELVEFSIAVRRPKSREETDFFRCVGWSGTATFIEEHFSKGDGIIIDGSLRQETWTAQDDTKRESVRVIVQDVYFPLGSSHEKGSAPKGVSKVVPVSTIVDPTDDSDDFLAGISKIGG